MIDVNLINGIALAFEGDAIYSTYVRRHLIFQGLTKPNQLHREATKYVSARAQANLISQMLEEKILTEKEEDIYKRGRNANSHTKAKNVDIVTPRTFICFLISIASKISPITSEGYSSSDNSSHGNILSTISSLS